jgi:hypothetical protein
VLVQEKNKRERSSPVRPQGVEKTSWLRSRDPVASGVKSHCVPWLIHKAKTEESKSVLQQLQTDLTGGTDWSDQWVPN